jgi:DNA-binding transcriptional MerR regulator
MLNSKKTYYSIREVCELTDLEPHVLRYWESEFPLLHPKKNRAGNRAYKEKDIEVVTAIKDLLYKEQFTIPGAKKKLAGLIKTSGDEDSEEKTDSGTEEIKPKNYTVNEVRDELKEVLRILEKVK